MTSPVLRDLSRRKLYQNLDTTALSVRKQTPQKKQTKTIVMPTCEQNDQKKLLVDGIWIKDNKNGKQINFSLSKIWWTSKVSLLAIENDCFARSYRFSVPLSCTRATIRQTVFCHEQSEKFPDLGTLTWRGADWCMSSVFLHAISRDFKVGKSGSYIWLNAGLTTKVRV